ncbi:protein-disulfide reductase DsbD family protein [Leclercia tamurae]|uniref:Thioredoxin family protein n=1 Tax=Leclercia tamurae TaxID=2926467 RepID=A0ABT2R8Y4_9ENTR|nr:protein-disulfide reductase DsbD domain-containing protein [Leclercia tamurae]MCU6677342.1 thioredoxin family protein [Leclercia tamurae]
MKTIFRSLWFLLFSLSAASAAVPGWSMKPENSHAQVHVWHDAPAEGKVRLLLDVTPNEGWKTYWRTPGDGGFRPVIAWEPQAKTQWHWPRPVRFDSAGFSSVGYDRRVVFPLEVATDERQRLRGKLTLSLCSTLCVVNTFPLDINLATGPSAQFADAWDNSMRAVPPDNGPVAVKSVAADNDTLTVKLTSPEGWSQPDLFPDNPTGVNLSPPQTAILGDTLTARFNVSDSQGKPLVASGLPPLSLLASDGAQSQQLRVDISSSTTLWQIMAVALAGGLILNLMPCVLPVLGIKLASLMTLAESSRRQTRMHFLATAAGIMFSFLVLAAVITGLRLSGAWIGWGFQFQSPWFIAAMVLVTWIFCFSLAGLLEIRLPSALSTRLATAGGNGIGGSFLEGAFATLLATPCTAPFLGTAVTFALAAPVHQLWLIFLVLGFGMSLPWLAISIVPGVARWLPKPGPWMGKLRLGLVLLMLGSCIWLMSLLVREWGARYVLIGGGLMVAFFLFRCAKAMPNHKDNLRSLVFGVLFGAGLYAFLAPQPQGKDDSPLNWQPLSEAALSEALNARKRVLVDITADWCLNCRVNEVLVLHRPEVIAALNRDDVVLLQGNWSQPSAEIERFLRRYGASGIPFNAIFGPAIPQGHVLPSLLSKDALLTTLMSANAATSPDFTEEK